MHHLGRDAEYTRRARRLAIYDCATVEPGINPVNRPACGYLGVAQHKGVISVLFPLRKGDTGQCGSAAERKSDHIGSCRAALPHLKECRPPRIGQPQQPRKAANVRLPGQTKPHEYGPLGRVHRGCRGQRQAVTRRRNNRARPKRDITGANRPHRITYVGHLPSPKSQEPICRALIGHRSVRLCRVCGGRQQSDLAPNRARAGSCGHGHVIAEPAVSVPVTRHLGARDTRRCRAQKHIGIRPDRAVNRPGLVCDFHEEIERVRRAGRLIERPDRKHNPAPICHGVIDVDGMLAG